MAEVPKNYFKRSVMLVGILSVIAVLYFAKWIRDEYALRDDTVAVAELFPGMQKVETPYYLPSDAVFLDTSGKEVRFKDYKGKYLVVNFWASWCEPCVQELPALQKLYDYMEPRGKWHVMAISIDEKYDLPKVSSFINQLGAEKVAGYYDHEAKLRLNIHMSGVPMTLIVNPRGRVLYKVSGGGMWNSQEMIEFLENVRKVYW